MKTKNRFEDLIKTFQESIFTWNYFTDFEKVKINVEKVKVELNILNSLIGEDNIILPQKSRQFLRKFNSFSILSYFS